MQCLRIKDTQFWDGLQQVLGDIEPICYGTNIAQSDSTRPDQVLIMLAGLYLHFSNHPEPHVALSMMKRIESRWKDCDQLLFLLAEILNPFRMLTHFGPRADLDQLKCVNMVIQVCYLLSSLLTCTELVSVISDVLSYDGSPRQS